MTIDDHSWNNIIDEETMIMTWLIACVLVIAEHQSQLINRFSSGGVVGIVSSTSYYNKILLVLFILLKFNYFCSVLTYDFICFLVHRVAFVNGSCVHLLLLKAVYLLNWRTQELLWYCILSSIVLLTKAITSLINK